MPRYARDGEKSTEAPWQPKGASTLPLPRGDVKSRIRRRNKKTMEAGGNVGSRKKGAGYISRKAKNRYMDQLDEAGKI